MGHTRHRTILVHLRASRREGGGQESPQTQKFSVFSIANIIPEKRHQWLSHQCYQKRINLAQRVKLHERYVGRFSFSNAPFKSIPSRVRPPISVYLTGHSVDSGSEDLAYNQQTSPANTQGSGVVQAFGIFSSPSSSV